MSDVGMRHRMREREYPIERFGTSPVDSHSSRLTDSQLDILQKITAAAKELPHHPLFECRRVGRYPFAWVIHDGFGKDVVAAAWDDLVALGEQGFIDMVLDDPDDCTFKLSDKAPTVGPQHLASSGEVKRPAGDSTIGGLVAH